MGAGSGRKVPKHGEILLWLFGCCLSGKRNQAPQPHSSASGHDLLGIQTAKCDASADRTRSLEKSHEPVSKSMHNSLLSHSLRQPWDRRKNP